MDGPGIRDFCADGPIQHAHACRVCKDHAHRPFLGYKPPGSDPARGYQWVTYGEFGTMVDRARALLHHAGIGKGDMVRTVLLSRSMGCPLMGKTRSGGVGAH